LLLRHVVQLIVPEMASKLKFMLTCDLSRIVIQDEIVKIRNIPVDWLEIVASTCTDADVIYYRIPGSVVRVRQTEFVGISAPGSPDVFESTLRLALNVIWL